MNFDKIDLSVQYYTIQLEYLIQASLDDLLPILANRIHDNSIFITIFWYSRSCIDYMTFCLVLVSSPLEAPLGPPIRK